MVLSLTKKGPNTGSCFYLLLYALYVLVTFTVLYIASFKFQVLYVNFFLFYLIFNVYIVLMVSYFTLFLSVSLCFLYLIDFYSFVFCFVKIQVLCDISSAFSLVILVFCPFDFVNRF